MSDFRRLSDTAFASPQILAGDIERAKDQGIVLIVNNRPDGEEPGAPQGAEIEASAEAAGIGYQYIPIDHSGFSEAQVDEMIAALDKAGGPVLAYCRSGTRSTFLWALAQAKAGGEPEPIAQAAYQAGYDISPILPHLAELASK